MSESRQTHVTLHDIDPQALDQLVQFAYTAEIVVGEGNVQVRPPHLSRPVPLPCLCLCSPHAPSIPCTAASPSVLMSISLSLLPWPSLPSCPVDSAPGRQPSAAEWGP